MLRIGSKSQDSKVEKLTLDYLVNNQLPKTRHSLNALKPEINEVLRRLRELDTACTKLKMSGDKSKHTEVCTHSHFEDISTLLYNNLQNATKCQVIRFISPTFY